MFGSSANTPGAGPNLGQQLPQAGPQQQQQQQAGPQQAQPQQQPLRGPATMQDVTDALANMMNAITQLTTAVQTLAARPAPPAPTVNATVNANREVAFVEKPAGFHGKDSASARLFRAAFSIYARGQPDKYAARDVNGALIHAAGGGYAADSTKWILGALSFMHGDAAEWARPYIEAAAENRPIFNNSRVDFWDAFKKRFEPIDEKAEALNKLQACTQGDRRFAEFFAEFQSLATTTGLSEHDLALRLRNKLNKDYLERLSYQLLPNGRGPTTYQELQNAGFAIDRLKDTLAQDLSARQGRGHASTSTAPARAFRDPDAMEIDAVFDDQFKGLTGDALKRQMDRVLRDRCKVCGSKGHRADDPRHRDVVCNHCGNKGHYQRLCRSRLEGRPPKSSSSAAVRATDTSSSATASSSSSSSDSEARDAALAALKDQLELIQKQISGFT